MSHTFWTNKTYEQQEIQLALRVKLLSHKNIPIQIQHPKNKIEW